jgi:aspartate 1-decarboxylase
MLLRSKAHIGPITIVMLKYNGSITYEAIWASRTNYD